MAPISKALQLQQKQWKGIIPATKQADLKKTKLPTGADEQVGRSNHVSWKRNVNRALQVPWASDSPEGLQEQPLPPC